MHARAVGFRGQYQKTSISQKKYKRGATTESGLFEVLLIKKARLHFQS